MGHEVTEEAREKLSAAMKGRKNALGCHRSEETREKIGAAKKGTKWWNNGVKNVHAKECPPGFISGMLRKRK